MEDAFGFDPAIVTWWGTFVECASALARLARDGLLQNDEQRQAMDVLRQSSLTWVEVPASDNVREQAVRLLRLHPLRAGDALHLAAAIIAADFDTSALEFVTLDKRQAEAAEREGFRVVG